jgi:hypothetical protein
MLGFVIFSFKRYWPQFAAVVPIPAVVQALYEINYLILPFAPVAKALLNMEEMSTRPGIENFMEEYPAARAVETAATAAEGARAEASRGRPR